MLAVNVTGSPNTLGLAEDVTFITVLPLVAAGGGGGLTTAQHNAHCEVNSRAARQAGDRSGIGITPRAMPCAWNSSGDGQATPQHRAHYHDLLCQLLTLLIHECGLRQSSARASMRPSWKLGQGLALR